MEDEAVEKFREENETTVDIFTTFTFDFNYDEIPQEISLFMEGIYDEK